MECLHPCSISLCHRQGHLHGSHILKWKSLRADYLIITAEVMRLFILVLFYVHNTQLSSRACWELQTDSSNLSILRNEHRIIPNRYQQNDYLHNRISAYIFQKLGGTIPRWSAFFTNFYLFQPVAKVLMYCSIFPMSTWVKQVQFQKPFETYEHQCVISQRMPTP